MTLSHLEVLSEVLIAAPPVCPDHVQTLVTASLMEVGVADVVLLSIDRESTVSMRSSVLLADLTQSVAPVLNHALLLYFKGVILKGMFILFLIMIQRRKD